MNHDDASTVEIRAGVELPRDREEIELHTADGLRSSANSPPRSTGRPSRRS